MSCPAHPSGFRNLLDTGFAVEPSELVVHSPPPHTVFLYSAKDRPKHPSFEHSKCLQVLFQHGPCFMSIEDHRSYKRFVHGTFGAGVNLSRPQLLLEPIVGATSTDDASPYFTTNVVISR
ncbi:AAEL017506-PA [Aedes aegypti]|uniref:AAEL017506-PA n=1 Tax=Aedes aegypti TaxID=7159 RepID=J9HSA2_AEDAE|nr:AAEL017506-PA [Aedes aegypti]